MRPKPAQLSVMAVAALAIVAVAAAMLLAGGNSAQATTAATLAPDSGGGRLPPLPQETGTSTHATPEPCPGETGNDNTEAAATVDSGHYALFDVWWNDDEGELTNTSCPPTVVHVPETPASGLDPAIPARDERSASNINIAKTVIHIPNSAKIDLSAPGNPYTQAKYPELWAADDLENRDTNGDGTFDGVGDRLVWALPACPPDGTPAAPEDGGLCLSFSAALLNAADWDGNIEYHLDHVHQIDIDKQDPRYTLGYDVPDAGTLIPYEALWNSANARVAVMPVAAGEYERPMWFFTSRGTYELQVHIRGNPNRPTAPQISGPEPIGVEESVTSDMREYTIHVGAEADLSVDVMAMPESPAPGDLVTITLAASNAGPEDAPSVKVDVALPDDLEYVSHEPTTATFAEIPDDDSSNDEESENTCPCDEPEFEPTHTWSLGAPLAKDASQTLAIKARVAQGTRGQDLTVKATISATETVVITESKDGQKVAQEYDVLVLDTDPENDMDTVTITVATIPNVDPMFRVTRSIDEDSTTDSPVGDPVVAHDPDNDPLEYWLTGPEAAGFKVNDQGQISLAGCGVLDYETKASYNFVLNVSDKKDADGNSDDPKKPVVDHYIGVLVQVGDVQGADDVAPNPGIGLSWDAQGNTVPNERIVTFTARPQNFVCGLNLAYSWWRQDPGAPGWIEQEAGGGNTYSTAHAGPATWEFQARISYQDDQGATRTVSSAPVSITWKAAGQ